MADGHSLASTLDYLVKGKRHHLDLRSYQRSTTSKLGAVAPPLSPLMGRERRSGIGKGVSTPSVPDLKASDFKNK